MVNGPRKTADPTLVLVLIAAIALGACQPSSRELRRGDRCLAEGDVERALGHYRVASRSRNPDVAPAALLLAAEVERDRRGDTEAAEELCEELVTRFVGTEEAGRCLRLMAEQRSARGDWWSAIDVYREFLAQRPDDADAEEVRHQLALCYVELGDAEQALVEWTDLLEAHPDGERAGDALLGVARCHDLAGHCGMAIVVYQRVRERFAGSAQEVEALVGEAGCLEVQGDLDGAQELYREALTRHPNPEFVQRRLDHLERSSKIRDPAAR